MTDSRYLPRHAAGPRALTGGRSARGISDAGERVTMYGRPVMEGTATPGVLAFYRGVFYVHSFDELDERLPWFLDGARQLDALWSVGNHPDYCHTWGEAGITVITHGAPSRLLEGLVLSDARPRFRADVATGTLTRADVEVMLEN